MKLSVPHYSQWTDVHDPFWMPRACGMVCVKMVLDFFKTDSPHLLSLLQEGKSDGGYHMTNGWIHDYEVEVLKRYGLSARRKEKMEDEAGIAELTRALEAGNPVIVSVVDFLLERKRFHQVLLVGYEEGLVGGVKGFYYHDPASSTTEGGAFLFCPIDKFLPGWRRMAIFVDKKI